MLVEEGYFVVDFEIVYGFVIEWFGGVGYCYGIGVDVVFV